MQYWEINHQCGLILSHAFSYILHLVFYTMQSRSLPTWVVKRGAKHHPLTVLHRVTSASLTRMNSGSGRAPNKLDALLVTTHSVELQPVAGVDPAACFKTKLNYRHLHRLSASLSTHDIYRPRVARRSRPVLSGHNPLKSNDHTYGHRVIQVPA